MLHYSFHECLVNRQALSALGIDRHTPDPQGGWIERDRRGRPTGRLVRGKRADYVVLRGDPTRVSAYEREEPGVVRTVVAGEVVYLEVPRSYRPGPSPGTSPHRPAFGSPPKAFLVGLPRLGLRPRSRHVLADEQVVARPPDPLAPLAEVLLLFLRRALPRPDLRVAPRRVHPCPRRFHRTAKRSPRRTRAGPSSTLCVARSSSV